MMKCMLLTTIGILTPASVLSGNLRSEKNDKTRRHLFSLLDFSDPKQVVQKQPGKNFLELAMEVGTDKVTTHAYNFAYENYLPYLRHSPVRFVEIGLGCDMDYGPGKSLDLWDQYFTHKDAHIFFIEYNAECAEKWKETRPRVSVDAGDQADVPFLRSFVEKHGGDFDIIVDDGGHTMVQQITSLIELLPSLKSGGLYFLEDLQTSYLESYGGGYLNEKSTIEYIKKMIDGLYGQGEATQIIDQIRHIDCYHEICVFIKK